jgi:hypothetical protein
MHIYVYTCSSYIWIHFYIYFIFFFHFIVMYLHLPFYPNTKLFSLLLFHFPFSLTIFSCSSLFFFSSFLHLPSSLPTTLTSIILTTHCTAYHTNLTYYPNLPIPFQSLTTAPPSTITELHLNTLKELLSYSPHAHTPSLLTSSSPFSSSSSAIFLNT